MKKIVILCLGILAELLICFADGYIQRGQAREAASAGAVAQEAASGVAEAQGAASGAAEAQGAASGGANAQGTAPGGAEVQAASAAANVLGADFGGADAPGDTDETIRVLIKTAGFASAYHDTVTVASAEGFTISSFDGEGAAALSSGGGDQGSTVQRVPAGQEREFFADSGDFEEGDVLHLTAADGAFEIRGLARDRESEVYEGELEIRRTDQGLLLINILPLEEYLRGVVPSEMPSSYPAEALKAQAICARTYAKKRMREDTMRYADVDDSVSYQVYNNQDRTEATDAAVRETAGAVLADENGLIDALYYSTSCGLDLDISLSKEEVFTAFLSEDSVRAYEADEPWYRWQTDIFLADLTDTAGQGGAADSEDTAGSGDTAGPGGAANPDDMANPGNAADSGSAAGPGAVAELSVQSRLSSGVVNVLRVTGTDGSESFVEGEYSVRAYLAGAGVTVTLQDGERVERPELLPSAFFILQPLTGEDGLYGYHILGGGYGHGIGMSQNGAKHMALEGYDYQEILQHYYKEAGIQR